MGVIWAGLDALPEYWRTPERAVVTWAEHLWEAGGRRVLDLGCGIGRHAVALARLGFAVTATDVSPSGLMACAAWLAREGLGVTLICHEMETLPFPDRAFDVIYHTSLALTILRQPVIRCIMRAINLKPSAAYKERERWHSNSHATNGLRN